MHVCAFDHNSVHMCVCVRAHVCVRYRVDMGDRIII